MSEETNIKDVDDTKAQAKEPSDSSPEDQSASTPDRTRQADDTGREGGEDDSYKIPKKRLDQEIQKRREIEKKLEQESGRSQKLEQRLDKLGKALQGEDVEDKTPAEVRKLASQYNVPPEFITDVANYVKEQATSDIKKDIEPLKKSAAVSSYQQEVQQLEQQIPEAKNMTSDEREKLKKMAHSPQYKNTPLDAIYKVVTYDAPRGSSNTAEPARGRSGSAGTDDMMKKIEDMTVEEFEKFSEDLAANNG